MRSWSFKMVVLAGAGVVLTACDTTVPNAGEASQAVSSPDKAHAQPPPSTPNPAHELPDRMAWATYHDVSDTSGLRNGQLQGHNHHLYVDWQLQPNIAALVGKAPLVIRGHVVSERQDAFRSYPYDHAKGRLLTAADPGVQFLDSPLVVTSIVVDEIVRAAQTAPAIGSTLDVLAPGGHIGDGCRVEPEDYPLPAIGDSALFLLDPFQGMTPIRTPAASPLYTVVGGFQGRMPISGTSVHPLTKQVVRGQYPDMDAQDGRDVGSLIADLRALG